MKRTENILANSEAVFTVGSKSKENRSSLKMAAAALVFAVSTMGFSANASAQSYTEYRGGVNSQQQVINNPAIPATVVRVKKVTGNQTDRYDRNNQYQNNRMRNLITNVLVTGVSTAAANQIDDSRTRRYVRTAAQISTASMVNRVQQRRAQNNNLQSGNVTHIPQSYEVYVNLQLPGGQVEQVAIRQSNGDFRRGDQVMVVSHSDGNASVVPSSQPRYSNRNRR